MNKKRLFKNLLKHLTTPACRSGSAGREETEIKQRIQRFDIKRVTSLSAL